MHTHDLSSWTHEHAFDAGNPLGERGTQRVAAFTAGMMAVEIAAGWLFGSMALLADGWHMGTHVAALGISATAYALARRYASDPRFSFGAWKIEVLGGFASANVLGMVALYMAAESVRRFFRPRAIRYDEALAVAALGLGVNLASALLSCGGTATGPRSRPFARGPAPSRPVARGRAFARSRWRLARPLRPQPPRGLHAGPRRRGDLGARDRGAPRGQALPIGVARSGDGRGRGGARERVGLSSDPRHEPGPVGPGDGPRGRGGDPEGSRSGRRHVRLRPPRLEGRPLEVRLRRLGGRGAPPAARPVQGAPRRPR